MWVGRMTQAEFSRRVQVAQSYLSALERGEKEPGAAVLLAISKEFGKSVDRLLTGKAFVEPKKRVTKDRQNVDSPFPTTGGLRAQRMGICQNYRCTMERGALGDPASDHSEVCEEC